MVSCSPFCGHSSLNIESPLITGMILPREMSSVSFAACYLDLWPLRLNPC